MATWWEELLRHTPLGILSDLDGTLLPFTSTPQGPGPSPELLALLNDLAVLPGVTITIVSGRPKDKLDQFFPPPRAFRLVAEHGAWRSARERWESLLAMNEGAVDSLVDALQRVQRRQPGTLLERKTWSVALHYRL